MSEQSHSSAAPEPTAAGRNVDAVVGGIEDCLNDITLDFERWEDPYARGPGLYFIVTRTAVSEFVTPMGANRWPTENCSNVLHDPDGFLEAARNVAVSCDGAIVVHDDGTIEETMVRANQLSTTEDRPIDDLPYADWMGARHMSALETAARNDVIAAITLSEEDGRVTVFRDGTFDESHAAPPNTD